MKPTTSTAPSFKTGPDAKREGRPDDPRIVFFGTPDFALPVFDRLYVYGYPIVAVVTVPDKPAGRKKELSTPAAKQAALARHIPVLQPATLKDPAFLEQFKALKPDLCVVAAYGKLIPRDYLDVPRLGFLNIHPSLLPEYRGPSPIQAAIMDGKTQTGVSIMLVDADMDHGPIIAADTLPLDPKIYYPDIAQELFEHGSRMLVEFLPRWIAGEIKPTEQDHAKATFCKLFDRENGKIDWNRPAEEIYNQIRALNREPGTWTNWKGKTFRILRAKLPPVCLPENPTPGTVISLSQDVAITTGSCPLILETVQIEGGISMSAADFVRGRANFVGSTLG